MTLELKTILLAIVAAVLLGAGFAGGYHWQSGRVSSAQQAEAEAKDQTQADATLIADMRGQLKEAAARNVMLLQRLDIQTAAVQGLQADAASRESRAVAAISQARTTMESTRTAIAAWTASAQAGDATSKTCADAIAEIRRGLRP